MRIPGWLRACCLVIVMSLILSPGGNAAEGGTEQYLIKLQPIPRLVKPENWTEQDNQLVADHFQRLQRLHAEGRVILAGRTLNHDDSAFGIVILEAASEAEARKLMEGDPAVKGGIMTARLFPYRVALIRDGDGGQRP